MCKMRQGEQQIRLRQKSGDPLRPLDDADRIVAEALGEPRRFPFAWIREPIKIK
jgi:hypothetical protein